MAYALSLRELASIGNLSNGGFLMLAKVHLDESNSNLQGKVCVVAGYIGYEDQWTGFMRDWEKILGNRKLHMRELRWRDSDRVLLAKLGKLPDEHRLSRVAGIVKNADFFKFVKGKIPTHNTNPYMIGAQLCVEHVLRITADEPCSIGFYFEEQSVYKWRIRDLNETLMGLNRDRRLVSVSTIRKEACRAFEVADYLSYSISQSREKPHGMRARWSKPIQGNGDCIGQAATPEFIRMFVEKCIELGMPSEGMINSGDDANAKGKTPQ
jgi:hypothetical protein